MPKHPLGYLVDTSTPVSKATHLLRIEKKKTSQGTGFVWSANPFFPLPMGSRISYIIFLHYRPFVAGMRLPMDLTSAVRPIRSILRPRRESFKFPNASNRWILRAINCFPLVSRNPLPPAQIDHRCVVVVADENHGANPTEFLLVRGRGTRGRWARPLKIISDLPE